MGKKAPETDTWWKNGVIYQIYPRSFMDSNGDGIGDIKGITGKLDYLNDGTENSLGIDAIWLSPIYPSPMKDFGYDISDYMDIDSMFGCLDDFKVLLQEAHKRNIRIIMDLVINHSSDEHPWFIESRQSKDSPKRDWYFWQPADKKRPNNWISYFELHNAWWLDKTTNEYYLGTFTKNQPEVNWRNKDLKKAMYDVIKYWFDMGIDGFRMDVVNWYIKDENLRNNPWKISFSPPSLQKHIYDRNQPESHQICKEIRDIANTYKDKVLIGEIYTNDVKEAVSYHGSNNDELHMAFNFNFLFQKWSAKSFYNSIMNWYNLLPTDSWPNFTLSNHDQPRHYYRYKKGNNSDARAKVAAAMLLTLKGTPFIYYGEELGMSCEKIPKNSLKDPLGIKGWPIIKGRDAERTPMQWDDTDNAGFSNNTPWLPVNKDYTYKNVANQKNDPDSLLSFYRSIIWLRKRIPCLSNGDIEFLIPEPNKILVYKRIYKQEQCIIILNFSGKTIPCPINTAKNYNVLLSTHRKKDCSIKLENLKLNPYEIIIAEQENT